MKKTNKQRGRASKSKGKRGELMLAKELNRLFDVQTRRGQQFSGEQGAADVVGIPGLHLESKNREKLNLHEALEKAQAESLKGEYPKTPIIFHKKNQKPWTVTCYLEALPEIVDILKKYPKRD